jgi:hypothetical protein
MPSAARLLPTCLLLALALLPGGPAAAQQRPSAEVLLPYFEVDLRQNGINTVFAVGNAEDTPVEIAITVSTNWGVPISRCQLTLAPGQVRKFDLRSWITGSMPGRKINRTEQKHLQAALLGQASPRDQLYYATAVAPFLAVGSVRIRTLGDPAPQALWGDYFLLDGNRSFGAGDTLVNIDPASACPGVCGSHALRFLTSGTFDGGTRVVVWTDVEGKPSKSAAGDIYLERADVRAHDDSGQEIGGAPLRILPLQVIAVADLGLRGTAGWIELRTERSSVVTVHYSARDRFGVALQSTCLR